MLSSESYLQNFIIRNPLKPFTKLCAIEWYPVPESSHYGKGDLVFKHPSRHQYLVVETKYLNHGTGRTARRNRWRNRRKVKKKAERYGRLWSMNHPGAKVQSAILVKEPGIVYPTLRMIWKNDDNQDWYRLDF